MIDNNHFSPNSNLMKTQMHTDLQQLRRRGVVREQIQGPGDDVTTRAAALVVLRLLPFAENLDGGKSSDLQQGAYIDSILWIPYIDKSSNDSLRYEQYLSKTWDFTLHCLLTQQGNQKSE